MNIGQHILGALENLSSNKLRSGLTMLGVIIGVASVISMLAIGAGAQNSITSAINGIGTNLVFVYSGSRTSNVTNPKPLTMNDVTAINDPLQAPDVLAAEPIMQGNALAAVGKESKNTTIMAVTPVYASMQNLKLAEGEFISADQNTGSSAVAVLGNGIATTLFGSPNNLVGQTVRLSGQPFRVIGVLESKGGSGFGSQDDQIMIPISTGQSRLFHRTQRDSVDQIIIQATSSDTVNLAGDEVTAILQSRHHTAAGSEDFTLFKQADILSTAQSITGVLTILLGGIGGISLVVGGIGIMNIMLVSVTERTREIGLRKALGARRRDILLQFLIESAMLSLIGGAVGVALAALISFAIGKIAAATGTAITPVVGLDSVMLATIFSAAVGLFFGIYPANRAANLEPVEALRSE